MVVHGPEIFDSGNAAWLLEHLAPSRTIVAGVMARTAAEESGLPVEFDGRPPSRVILDVEGPVFLANHGKTPYRDGYLAILSRPGSAPAGSSRSNARIKKSTAGMAVTLDLLPLSPA